LLSAWASRFRRSISDEVVLGLVAEARRLGNGKVAHFGLLFGRNFSVMSGLTRAVDAAINLGGPIDKSFEREVFARLPFGTERIWGNDISFDRKPSRARPSRCRPRCTDAEANSRSASALNPRLGQRLKLRRILWSAA
jgi:hypothetical protein